MATSYVVILCVFTVLLVPNDGNAQNASTTDDNSTYANFDLEEQFFSDGNALFDGGNYQGAIDDYDKALSLVPNDSDAMYQKGRALNNLGQYAAAISYYDQVLSISPNDTDVMRSKGISLENLGENNDAIEYFDKVLSISSNDTEALYHKGLTYENMTDYVNAASNYNKAILIDPTDSNTLYHMGKSLQNLGNSTGAIFYYDKALALDPTNTNILNAKNLIKGESSVDLTTSTRLDDNLLEIIVGVFIAILIGIIIIDRIQKRKQGRMFVPVNIPVEQKSVVTLETQNYVQSMNKLENKKHDLFETKQTNKVSLPNELKQPSIQVDSIADSSELEMIRELLVNNFGNSIMLNMIKHALEQNKPVNKIEMDYVRKKYNQFSNTKS